MLLGTGARLSRPDPCDDYSFCMHLDITTAETQIITHELQVAAVLNEEKRSLLVSKPIGTLPHAGSCSLPALQSACLYFFSYGLTSRHISVTMTKGISPFHFHNVSQSTKSKFRIVGHIISHERKSAWELRNSLSSNGGMFFQSFSWDLDPVLHCTKHPGIKTCYVCIPHSGHVNQVYFQTLSVSILFLRLHL